MWTVCFGKPLFLLFLHSQIGLNKLIKYDETYDNRNIGADGHADDG